VKRPSSRSVPSKEFARERTVARRKLVSFLCDRHSYPERPRSVRFVQTHASYVVITDRYVYKVKKAVDLGFLDFSTLEKRRHFCEREVLLNRRLTSHVHLGVLPIFLNKGQLAFANGGPVVEYAIQMRKLDFRYFLPRLLRLKKAGRSQVKRIVATLKRFYQAQTPTAPITRWGSIDKLKISTDENFRQTEKFIGDSISRPGFEAIRHFTNRFYREQARLFARRMREHRIRDCHGDLRLEHIHVAPRHLSIYDCIEFNDRLRYLDWANDLAFLAMDFDYQGRPDLADYFVKEMATALDDEDLLALVDFYKCYRAYVRGKVETFQSVDAREIAAKEANLRKARNYFKLALSYAVAGSKPLVVVVMGRIASGKSTLARMLGRELDWPVFSSDVLRKTLGRVPLGGGEVNARKREQLYAERMTEKTYQALLTNAIRHARKRDSVILDATYSRRSHRDQLRERLRRAGVAFCFVETRTSNQIIRRRLKERTGETAQASDARIEDFPKLSKLYAPPKELPRLELAVIRTSKVRPEATMTNILKALAARRAQANRSRGRGSRHAGTRSAAK
jgi:aminoglycoside phosphotransferase family enzyme/predicted kinase